MRHGFPPDIWEAAKDEAKALMIERAKKLGMITYSELVKGMTSIKLEPNSSRLSDMLGEISSEEDAANRGMLTALVVHKQGDMEPGPGFYILAASLGRNTRDKQKCWIEELHRVHEYWSAKR
ncbi:MAG: hypothetical protein ABL962_15715 [Fimbriimonadaceae bacterium]